MPSLPETRGQEIERLQILKVPQIAALEKRCHAAVDHRSPEPVLGLIALVIHPAERVKMLIQQLPQVGGLRIAWLKR